MIDRTLNLLELFNDRRVVVMGDIMLDRFIYGRVQRISPEAPIPVLLKERERVMLGGAGNVARNVAALSGIATLIGAIGDDPSGDLIRRELAITSRIIDHTICIGGASTTEKARYISQQQLLRVDSEHKQDIPAEQFKAALKMAIPNAEAIVLSDYAKGLLTPALISHAIAEARVLKIPVLVDPKTQDIARYDGATLLTPNRSEAEAATGISIDDDSSAAQAAHKILDHLPHTDAVVITRGERGMTLLERGLDAIHLRTEAREVFDVSGAGDTVMAALAIGLAAHLPLTSAVRLANAAAGIVVGKPGTATAGIDELDRSLRAEHVQLLEDKIIKSEHAHANIQQWHARGQVVGFTNGCFDLVHPGHISLLTQARAQCDRLVVGLNSDTSIRRLKGPNRPIQGETARAIVLASLTQVDAVVIFDEDTPLSLIKELKPDILVKGADYQIKDVVGASEVQSWGGKVFLAALTPNQSTTRIAAKMAGTAPAGEIKSSV